MPTKSDYATASKDFEAESFFSIDGSNSRECCNRVPTQGDFYAMRHPGYRYDNKGVAEVEYFLFKKEGAKLRPATFKEFKDSDVMKHLLADCDNFHKQVLENVLDKNKFVTAMTVVCDDKVATFGGKAPLTVSFPSEHDRECQKAHADTIDKKIRKSLEKSLESFEKNRKPRVPLRDF